MHTPRCMAEVSHITRPQPLSVSQVSKEKKGVVVDARCRDLTNATVVQKGRDNPGSVDLCNWHEVRVAPSSIPFESDRLKNLGKTEPGKLVPPGVWTLADVMEYGHKHGTCPYFTVRRMVSSTPYGSLPVTEPHRDAVCRRNHLFLPLPTGPKSCRSSIKGTREGRDRCIRRGPQHRQIRSLSIQTNVLTALQTTSVSSR